MLYCNRMFFFISHLPSFLFWWKNGIDFCIWKNHYHVPTMCKVLGDANQQLGSCRLNCLEEQKSLLIKFPLSSGRWSEAQSTFPSGKVTGENAFAAVADEELGWPPSLLINAQRLGENDPSLHPPALCFPLPVTPQFQRWWEPQSEIQDKVRHWLWCWLQREENPLLGTQKICIWRKSNVVFFRDV